MYFHFQNTITISMIKILAFCHKRNLVFLCYLLINTLFVLKYGARQKILSIEVLIVSYVLAITFGFIFLFKIKDWLNRFRNFHFFFLLFSIIVFIVFIGVNLLVDKHSLNVDRWSALEVFISSILNGDYPYDVKDHLGKTSSNLPGLFYIGCPFYLLSDVGFLQPFVFLLIVYVLQKMAYSNFQKTVFLFLLMMSPAYLWEIVVKSDLMSNLFLTLLFIILWDKKYQKNLFEKPILLSFFGSFLILTRGIVFIPLILFLFDGFMKSNLLVKIKFVGGLIFFSVLISMPILISIPTVDIVIEHNPFNHQTNYAPKVLIVISLIIPFLISSYMKSSRDVFYYSFLIVVLLMFSTFTINILQEGFLENIYADLFDLSYLSMALPFAIFYLLNDTQVNRLFNESGERRNM